MSPFAKLDSKITRSSLWSEPYHVRIVFVSMLAMKDDTGFVGSSEDGIRRESNVTVDECRDAINVLESPDPHSMTKEHDGRRIMKVEGGWTVLNHEKYKTHEDKKKEYQREYMKKFRAVKLTESNSSSHSISISESVSEDEGKNIKNIIPPQIEWVAEYCKERNNGVDPQKWYDFYESKGWVIGKNKMKSWKAAVRTWEKSTNTTQHTTKPTNRIDVAL